MVVLKPGLSKPMSTNVDVDDDPLHMRFMALINGSSDLLRSECRQIANTLCFLVRNKYGRNLPNVEDFNVILVREAGKWWRMDVTLRNKVIMYGDAVSSRRTALEGLRDRIEWRAAEIVRKKSGPARDKGGEPARAMGGEHKERKARPDRREAQNKEGQNKKQSQGQATKTKNDDEAQKSIPSKGQDDDKMDIDACHHVHEQDTAKETPALEASIREDDKEEGHSVKDNPEQDAHRLNVDDVDKSASVNKSSVVDERGEDAEGAHRAGKGKTKKKDSKELQPGQEANSQNIEDVGEPANAHEPGEVDEKSDAEEGEAQELEESDPEVEEGEVEVEQSTDSVRSKKVRYPRKRKAAKDNGPEETKRVRTRTDDSPSKPYKGPLQRLGEALAGLKSKHEDKPAMREEQTRVPSLFGDGPAGDAAESGL